MKTIYVILDLTTWCCYVGATNRFSHRKHHHQCLLRHGKHRSKKLQRAYDFFGEDNFCYLEVDTGGPEVELAWIEALDSKENGYNVVTDHWSGPEYEQRSFAIKLARNNPRKARERSRRIASFWLRPSYRASHTKPRLK